jgi:hypothetical protein
MLQNYNKILTKRTVFSIILEQNPDQDLHKNSAYFTHPDFSGAKIEKMCANYARKYGILCKLICCSQTKQTFNVRFGFQRKSKQNNRLYRYVGTL